MSRRRRNAAYRVWMNERVYVEARLLPSHILEIDPEYQRRIDLERVERMVEEFDPCVVNSLKVSHRGGRFFVFDGGHTLMILKKINDGKNSFLVECRVYENLTEAEEKILFAKQTGLAKPISVNDKMNALAGAGDPETMDIIRATNASGVNLAIREHKGTSVCAVGKARSLYRNFGSQAYENAVSLIMSTWHGMRGSLQANMLGGVTAFLDAFGSVYDRDRFIRKLKNVEPKDILATAKRNKTDYQTLDKACATEIAKAYNKGRGAGRLESFVVV